MSIIIRPAEQQDFDACVQMCTDSFMGYDFSKIYCTKNEEKRRRFTETIFDIAIGLGIKNRQLLIMEEAGKMLAAADLQSPADKDYSFSDYLRYGILNVFRTAGIYDTLGYLRMLERSEKECKRIKEPHWYVLSFAVHEEHQREGLGTYMIQHGVVPYVQQHGGGLLALVTNSVTNECFYKHNGFVTVKEEILSVNRKELGNWTMTRRIECL